MKVALVSMPWAIFTRQNTVSPFGYSLALLERDEPQYQVECKLAFASLYRELGTTNYFAIANAQYEPVGELLYAAHVYPDRSEAVKSYFSHWMSNKTRMPPERGISYDELFDTISKVIEQRHLKDLPAELAEYDVVNFLVTSNQLFASVAASQALKKLNPGTRIVFRGWQVSTDALARSVLQEYPEIDFALSPLEDEGEHSFLQLLRAIEHEDPSVHEISGIHSQENCSGPVPTRPAVVEPAKIVLDELPIPNYDAFARLADEMQEGWIIPIEGSRGCWWDRVRASNNTMDTCRFCRRLGDVYLQKSASKIVAEMKTLAKRYEGTTFRFTDDIAPPNGVEELATLLKRENVDFAFEYTMRAHLSPHDILQFREAGLVWCQFGIEGFSSAFLRRVNKGMKTIQNLQAMKTCFELELECQSFIVTEFPGTPQEEVDESARNMLDYAICYQPTSIFKFQLLAKSSVAAAAEEFGLSNLRNLDDFQTVLPDDVYRRLKLFYLSYDQEEAADWTPVKEAQERWRELHRSVNAEPIALGSETGFLRHKPLSYADGGSFLEIDDWRDGLRNITLEGAWREIYLYCMEIQKERSVLAHFGPRYGEETVREVLTGCVDAKLMFAEDQSFLSLAASRRPQDAARRIRLAHEAKKPNVATVLA